MPAVGSGRQATQVPSHDARLQGSLPVIDFWSVNTVREDIARSCFVVSPLCRAKKPSGWNMEGSNSPSLSCIVVHRRASNGMSSEEYMQDRCGRMGGLNTIGPEVQLSKCLLSAWGRGQVIQ